MLARCAQRHIQPELYICTSTYNRQNRGLEAAVTTAYNTRRVPVRIIGSKTVKEVKYWLRELDRRNVPYQSLESIDAARFAQPGLIYAQAVGEWKIKTLREDPEPGTIEAWYKYAAFPRFLQLPFDIRRMVYDKLIVDEPYNNYSGHICEYRDRPYFTMDSEGKQVKVDVRMMEVSPLARYEYHQEVARRWCFSAYLEETETHFVSRGEGWWISGISDATDYHRRSGMFIWTYWLPIRCGARGALQIVLTSAYDASSPKCCPRETRRSSSHTLNTKTGGSYFGTFMRKSERDASATTIWARPSQRAGLKMDRRRISMTITRTQDVSRNGLAESGTHRNI